MTSQTQPSRNRLQQSGLMYMVIGILLHALSSFRCRTASVLVATLLSLCSVVSNVQAAPAPGATCVVTAQNRTAPMNADGSYVLSNLPGNGLVPFGTNASAQPFRVRAVCDDGTLGETPMAFPDFEQVVVLSGDIVWGQNTPKPSRLELLYPSKYVQQGQILSPTLVGYYEDGSTQDLTQRLTGTGYRSSFSVSVGVAENGGAFLQSNGYGQGAPVVITAENDGVVASRILMPATNIQLTGIVYKVGGTVPAVGAKVRLLDFAMEATADANGQYRFDNLSSGLIRLMAYEPSTRSSIETSIYAYVNSNVKKDMVLAGVGAVTVTVVDANNVPLQDIDVAIADSAANAGAGKVALATAPILKTDAQGIVTFQGVAAGNVLPVLSIKGYSSTPATAKLLADGSVSFNVKVMGNLLGGVASLTGTVSEIGTGNPGAGIVVRLTEQTGFLQSFSFVTGAGGKFIFDGLQAASIYQVELLKNNIDVASGSIQTGSAGTVTVKNFTYNRVTGISGIVRNGDGVTVAPNTSVTLSQYLSQTWWPGHSVVTDAQGLYQFLPHEPGHYRIDAVDQSGQVTSAEVDVLSGESIVVDLTLGGAGPIVTRVALDIRDRDFASYPSLGDVQIFVTNGRCVSPCLMGATQRGVPFYTEILPLGLNVFEARRDGFVAEATVDVDALTNGQTVSRTVLLPVSIHETMGVLDFVAQRTLYSFSAMAGEKVDLSIVGAGVNGSPAAYASKIEIFDPSKALIASGYGLRNSPSGAIKSLVLASSGTYSVVVSPYYNAMPQYLGGYWLALSVNGSTRQLQPFVDGGSVEGKVFKKDGITLKANQLVDLRTLDALGLHERRLTDASGKYRFDNVPLADLIVSAIEFELVQTSVNGRLVTPGEVIVKDLLVPAGRISGKLTYQGGMAVQGSTLTIRF